MWFCCWCCFAVGVVLLLVLLVLFCCWCCFAVVLLVLFCCWCCFAVGVVVTAAAAAVFKPYTSVSSLINPLLDESDRYYKHGQT